MTIKEQLTQSLANAEAQLLDLEKRRAEFKPQDADAAKQFADATTKAEAQLSDSIRQFQRLLSQTPSDNAA